MDTVSLPFNLYSLPDCYKESNLNEVNCETETESGSETEVSPSSLQLSDDHNLFGKLLKMYNKLACAIYFVFLMMQAPVPVLWKVDIVVYIVQ